MKLRVIREFADKYDGTKIYNVGETLETDDQERVKDLTDRRLAEVIEGDKTEEGASKKSKVKGQKPKGKKSKAADEATGDATEEAAGDAASESAGDAADEAVGDAAGDGDDNGNGGETASHSN